MTERPLCSAFSENEIIEIRRTPAMFKAILAIFIAIVVLIFVPFQTVTKLAEQVGTLSAIVNDRRAAEIEFKKSSIARLSALENKTCLPPKKFYWINRNSREANEKLKDLKTFLGSLNCSQRFQSSEKAELFPPRSESGLPGR